MSDLDTFLRDPLNHAPGSSRYDRSAQAREMAANIGCRVVVPAPNQLFLDIDSQEQYEHYLRHIDRLGEFEMVISQDVRPSPSGKEGHFHIVVTLARDLADAEERILLQAIFGSDPVRELLSYLRVRREDPEPTLFFEKIEADE